MIFLYSVNNNAAQIRGLVYMSSSHSVLGLVFLPLLGSPDAQQVVSLSCYFQQHFQQCVLEI